VADNNREWTKFGRYALLERIGAGGMAEIFRAKTFGAAGFEKEFAIKLILPALVHDTEFVDMFINEAKIAVSLYHANVVQVFDLGELDNQYYIAMEFVHGKDLLDVLARCAEMGVKIPLNLVLFVTMEMLKGLDFAHRAKDPYGDDLNIIHRDVSPSNILISYAGDVKVGDFGVAKAAFQRNMTESGTLKGKVGYMSPEQVMGEAIDYRSDIFSACIVFFEALSMNRLFVGNSDLDVMLRVRDAEIDSSIAKAGPLPGDLLDIVRKGLSRHREERYQTAGEFYQDLVDFCFKYSIKVNGSDLSNFMRLVFAREIEHEKNRRRSEPGGPAMARPETDTASHRAVATRPAAPSSSSPSIPVHGSAPLTAETLAPLGPDVSTSEVTRERPRTDVKTYRFRDAAGLVFGPMGEKTLHDFLRARRPRPDDRLSINGGPWQNLDATGEVDVNALKVSDESRPLREHRPTPSLVNSHQAATEPPMRKEPEPSHSMSQIIQKRRQPRLYPDEPSSPQVEGLSAASQVLPSLTLTEEELGLSGETFQELKDQYASYEGDLRAVSIARILARLHRSHSTGRLYVKHDAAEKSVYLRHGEPIFVDSDRKDELLGNFLISRKIITEAQLQNALARLSEWGGRLGDALVAIGAIPAHEIFRHLTDQMREKILEIFTWEQGYYGYFENQEPAVQGYPLGLETYDTIIEGCRERMPLARIQSMYRNRSHVAIYPRQPPPVEIERLKLRAREMRILHNIEPGENLRSLLGRVPADQEEFVYRTLYLLHQVEFITFEVTEKSNLPAG
jgi:eukaryotic-like serine/threonine-protein kinase